MDGVIVTSLKGDALRKSDTGFDGFFFLQLIGEI